MVRNSFKLDVLEDFDVEQDQTAKPAVKDEPDIMPAVEDEEFMKLLQENMSKLLGGPQDPPHTFPSISANNGNFQDTISQTLNKLKTSSTQAQVIYS